jgi:hypothetical protein
METSTRIIDYCLKGCMEGGFSKMKSTGRTKQCICIGCGLIPGFSE